MAKLRKTKGLPLMRFDHLGDLEGFLYRTEGAYLAHLASLVPADRVIVELGSYKGKSTAFLASGAKAGAGAKVFAVDLWDLGGQPGQENVRNQYDSTETYRTFERQVREARCWSQVTPIKGDSVETGLNWDGPTVGLLFIDSHHTAAQVAAELDAWLPHVDGTVAFHDYGGGKTEVTQFLDEWVGDRPYAREKRVVSVEV